MRIEQPPYHVSRLVMGQQALAKRVFSTMAEVFGEEHEDLRPEYVARLLEHEGLWILAATLDDEVVGGLTAHTLPMTRSESSEIFIYDVAVRADHRRRGVGRLLMSHLARLASEAGILDLFVPADDDDAHALEFYRSLGGKESRVSFFVFER
jgi:aminoglycoside 3-N-acetyltransferase I